MDWRTTRWAKCAHEPCTNPARYSSGYCGIHDIEFNSAKGERVPEPPLTICAGCKQSVGVNYYSGVPGVGALCLSCWKEWRETR